MKFLPAVLAALLSLGVVSSVLAQGDETEKTKYPTDEQPDVPFYVNNHPPGLYSRDYPGFCKTCYGGGYCQKPRGCAGGACGNCTKCAGKGSLCGWGCPTGPSGIKTCRKCWFFGRLFLYECARLGCDETGGEGCNPHCPRCPKEDCDDCKDDCDTCGSDCQVCDTCDPCGKKKGLLDSLFSKKKCGSCDICECSTCDTCDPCGTCGKKKGLFDGLFASKKGCGCDTCDYGTCDSCNTCEKEKVERGDCCEKPLEHRFNVWKNRPVGGWAALSGPYRYRYACYGWREGPVHYYGYCCGCYETFLETSYDARGPLNLGPGWRSAVCADENPRGEGAPAMPYHHYPVVPNGGASDEPPTIDSEPPAPTTETPAAEAPATEEPKEDPVPPQPAPPESNDAPEADVDAPKIDSPQPEENSSLNLPEIPKFEVPGLGQTPRKENSPSLVGPR